MDGTRTMAQTCRSLQSTAMRGHCQFGRKAESPRARHDFNDSASTSGQVSRKYPVVRCCFLAPVVAAHNRLVAGSSPAGPTTQSRGRGDFLDRRQMPAIGGLSFRRPVSATAHFSLRRGLGACVSAAKFLIPGKQRPVRRRRGSTWRMMLSLANRNSRATSARTSVVAGHSLVVSKLACARRPH